MRQLVAVFLVLNIALSVNAAFLNKPSSGAFTVFNQLKAIEEKEFGNKLLETVALQLQSKSPLGDIANMLAELRQDLVTQQAEADQLNRTNEQTCQDNVANLERRISEQTARQEAAEQQIGVLTAEIGQLEGEIRVKESQLSILNNREVELDEARARDAEEFVRRQEQAREVVPALELIVEKLSTIEANTNDESLFQEQAMVELAKIGKSNPIAALVQVASTFSQESLDFVIGKMEELKADLLASIENDAQEEQDAIAEYNTLKAEITQTRNQVVSVLADLKTQLATKQAQLAQQERERDEAIANIAEAQEALAAEHIRCDELRTKYAREKQQRADELAVVKQVEAIVATKLETMKDYLKERLE